MNNRVNRIELDVEYVWVFKNWPNLSMNVVGVSANIGKNLNKSVSTKMNNSSMNMNIK
jgi:hypothetical protein